MARPESEPHPIKENGNIRVASPADLMRENPAALIVNRESYGRMVAHFSPDQFDPPQVVKVSTFSSEHGEVVRDFVLDGMTRTKFVSDNQLTIAAAHPDFTFRVRDVTASTLQNTAIVPAEEKSDGQQALTMIQYLRAVIPPTIEHSQIAPDRIAAHLINGWDNMVGENLSQKYSALAALSLLGNQGINIATDDGLRKDLAKQPRLMAGEAIEERVRLQQALVEMGGIIRQTRLNRQEIARSAFMLVGAESPVIGGGKEAGRQIYGLLHTPEVDRKLEEAFSNIGEREQMRQQLGKFVSESFRKVGKNPNKEEVTNVLGTALRDPNLKFNHVIDVFTSDEPVARYDQVRENVNKDRLTRSYMASHKLKELGPVESQLINRLGGRTVLQDTDIPGLVRTIKSAESSLQRANGFKTQLATERDQLIASGVHSQLIDEALPKIEAIQAEVTAATTLATVSRKNQELVDTVNEVNRRMNTQMTIHRVGGMVDQAAGDKLTEGYGPQIRTDIVGLVLGEFRTIEDVNLPQVKRRIQELSSLSPNLLLKVKNGDIRLSVALQRQREESRPATAPTPRVEPAAPAIETRPTTAPVVTPPTRFGAAARLDIAPPTPPRVEPPVRPIEPTQPPTPEDSVIDKQQLEERRKQVNREKLTRILDALDPALRDIDLAPQDLTEVEREAVNRVIRKLGQLGYNHPNTPQVMLEHYPRLQEEVRGLRESLVAREQELTHRETRTQR